MFEWGNLGKKKKKKIWLLFHNYQWAYHDKESHRWGCFFKIHSTAWLWPTHAYLGPNLYLKIFHHFGRKSRTYMLKESLQLAMREGLSGAGRHSYPWQSQWGSSILLLSSTMAESTASCSSEPLPHLGGSRRPDMIPRCSEYPCEHPAARVGLVFRPVDPWVPKESAKWQSVLPRLSVPW